MQFVSKKRIVGFFIVAVVLVGIVLYAERVNRDVSDTYQAVFLTNNQVYFGKVSSRNSRFITLTDIYYIQLPQPLQSQGEQNVVPTNLNLVKLGNELHAPHDEMQINRDHVLFIENLKPESQVVTAIENYKQNQGN